MVIPKDLESIRKSIYESSTVVVDITDIFDHEAFDSGFPPIGIDHLLALNLTDVSDEEPYVGEIGDGAYTKAFYEDNKGNIWELRYNMERYELALYDETGDPNL